MKKPIIIIAVILLSVIILWLVFFETIGIVIKNDNEMITDVSLYSDAIAIVTDNGNVFVKGRISEDRNYGIECVREYNHLLSAQYARIYDHNDAISVNINKDGGCIVTNRSQVYLFMNDSIDYHKPTLLCSGYKKAVLSCDRVYMLSCDGLFGCIYVNEPDAFYPIGENVADFDVEFMQLTEENHSDCFLFVLTEDDRLFVLEEDEDLTESTSYIDNIIGFDTVSFCSTLLNSSMMKDHIEISLLDVDHNAYWYETDLDKNFNNISNIDNYTITGSDVDKVVSYNRGVAMLNSKNEVSLYGYDFDWWNEELFQGEVMFSDVCSVFSGHDSLVILFDNGDVKSFRYENYFGINNSIT